MTYTSHKLRERVRKRWRICFARPKKLSELDMTVVLLQNHRVTPSGFLVGVDDIQEQSGGAGLQGEPFTYCTVHSVRRRFS